MGKRKRKSADSDDEILRKIRRLERRMERRRDKNRYRSESEYSDDHYGERESQGSPETEPDYTRDWDSDDHSVKSVVSVPTPAAPVQQENSNATSEALPDPVPTSAEPPELPASILALLGESKEKDEIFGPKIREEISKRWGKIIMEGLNKDQKQKLMEGILIPENFQLLKAPKLNPEIGAVLSESTKNRDKRLEKAQNHLGTGISALTNLMTSLIDGEIPKDEIIKKLSEAGQILLDLHSRETITRRQLITYSLDKKFFNMVKDVKRDSFLFGENLGDKIKASKTAEKSGLQVKRKFEPQPSTSYRSNRPTSSNQGNLSKGPSSRQYNQRGRPGGPRPQTTAPARRQPPAVDRYSSSTLKPSFRPPPRK